MNKAAKIFLVLLCIFCVERFCRIQTAGFRIEKILGEFESQEKVPLTLEAKKLLEKPFTFLGSGVQSYAFVSADQTTVLKVFKHYHTPPRTQLLKKIPLPFWLEGLRTRLLEARAERMRALFESHRIAFENLKEETGLLHLQLEPSDAPIVTLYDKIGICHPLDLSGVPFVLQKRATLVFPSLECDLKANPEHAKEKIRSLIQVVKKRCEKEIASSDAILHRNFGFLGTQAIEIDTGSYTKRATPALRKELYFETLELQEWLEKRSPPLAQYLKESILEIP